MSNRRDFLSRLVGLGSLELAGLKSGTAKGSAPLDQSTGRKTGSPPIPVATPDVPDLPFHLVDGVKEFHLIAEVVRTEFVPGRPVTAWGFNGSVPGPTIQINQGDRVRVIFENRLPEMTAIHWHGFEVPMEMDGSVGLGQDPVQPGGKYIYEFTLNQTGTFFYHSHFAMQEMMGMLGLFIMHPRQAQDPRADRDFGILLQEWAILPNNTVPNTMAMEYNWLTFNGKAGPATTPLLVKQGERVRIRFVNLGMDHHPIHLHGNQFSVTGTEAGRTPENLWYPQNTVLVGVAQARDIEFDAKFSGDWMLHCHLPHHMMNNMASMAGPISHSGHGLQTGGGLPEGMGMLRQGDALSEGLGPSVGRGIGVSADRERPVSPIAGPGSMDHSPLDHSRIDRSQMEQGKPDHDMAAMDMPGRKVEGMDMSGMGVSGTRHPQAEADRKRVPGYPQDMWMVMDEMGGDKPELYGLRKGWSGAMMGMMTLVRVLPPETYDKIMAMKARQTPQSIPAETPPAKPAATPEKGAAHEHHHG